jgi:hypothetical protein
MSNSITTQSMGNKECKHKWILVAQQMKCNYCGQVYQVK